MQQKHKHNTIVDNMREIVFGVEDSLVSTVGAVTGIAAGAQSTKIVILSGLVLIAVEALSMAAGSYLSSKSATEAEAVERKQKERHIHPVRAAVWMGVCYTFGGFIPLVPYVFLPIAHAYAPSITGTVIALFVFGAWSARYTRRIWWKSGLEMVIVSSSAALLGFAIGRAVGHYVGTDLPV